MLAHYRHTSRSLGTPFWGKLGHFSNVWEWRRHYYLYNLLLRPLKLFFPCLRKMVPNLEVLLLQFFIFTQCPKYCLSVLSKMEHSCFEIVFENHSCPRNHRRSLSNAHTSHHWVEGRGGGGKPLSLWELLFSALRRYDRRQSRVSCEVSKEKCIHKV